MKFKTLYARLLLSFLGILFITMILIFVLFIATAGKSFRDSLDNQSFDRLKMFQDILQEKIEKMPGVPLNENQEIKDLLNTFSAVFNLKIWITSPGDTLLLKTFSTPIDFPIEKTKTHKIIKDGIRIYYQSRRQIPHYSEVPVKTGSAINTLHIYLSAGHTDRPEALFLFGLLSIGAIIAALIVPLTKIITIRIRQLNRSALEFADGNLDKRIRVKGRDEIAELGNSFNFMADKLEKIIRGNKELTANISHELRSPLTRIRVSNEMIWNRLESDGDQDIKRYVKNIEQEIQVLDTLIEKILMISKMDLQESELSIESLDFNAMIKDLEKKFTPFLKQKNLRLTKDVKGPVILNTDKTLVFTILMNLMDNAVKYTVENGAIQIKATKTEKDILIFSITNTYRSLKPMELEKIFEPFFRIESGPNPGTGLGLSIVKKLIIQCKSRISAKNTDMGLSFEIQFQDQ